MSLQYSLRQSWRGLRDGSVVKSTCFSSQVSVACILGDPTPSSDLCQHGLPVTCLRTCRQNIHTHELKINTILKSKLYVCVQVHVCAHGCGVRGRVVVYLILLPSAGPPLVWDPPTRAGRLASGSQGSACLYFSVP